MKLAVGPLEGAGGMGAEVRNLDPERLDDPGLRRELYDLWIDKGLIVFRGLTGPAAHVRLSRCFGSLQGHPVSRGNDGKAFPELISVRYAPPQLVAYEVDGREPGAWLPWHFDLVYMDVVNHGGILRPVQLPSSGGGETGFNDRIALYERLPAELKARIEGLSVIYKFDINAEHLRYARPKTVKLVRAESASFHDLVACQDEKYPRVVHPLVYVQAETGRKVLNFSPWFAVGVQGMDQQASDALLIELGRHCSDEKHAYYHRWREDDMVLWDNWRMLHCATGVPVEDRRIMERTTIAGDYGLGRFEDRTARAATPVDV
jgi:taurine dioxygenase